MKKPSCEGFFIFFTRKFSTNEKMDLSLWLNFLSLVIAVLGTTAAVAGLNNEGRSRFLSWTKNAVTAVYKSFVVCFFIIALINGMAGVYLFSIEQGDPSRKDILNLVLFLVNIGIGLVGLKHLIELSIKNKNIGS